MWLNLADSDGNLVSVNLAAVAFVTRQARSSYLGFADGGGTIEITEPESVARLAAALEWHAAQAQEQMAAAVPAAVVRSACIELLDATVKYLGAPICHRGDETERLGAALQQAREALREEATA